MLGLSDRFIQTEPATGRDAMKKRHLKALLSITPSLKWLGILIVCHSISAEPVILSFRPVNGVIELETTLDHGFDYVALRLRNTVDGPDQVWVSNAYCF